MGDVYDPRYAPAVQRDALRSPKLLLVKAAFVSTSLRLCTALDLS